MKTLNKKIFLRYPIAFAASILALTGNDNADFQESASRVAEYFNNLDGDCAVQTTESRMLERPTDQQLQMIMKFAHDHLGIIEKFTCDDLGFGDRVYHLVCSRGMFRLVLNEAHGQIQTLRFLPEVAHLKLSLAA